MYIGFALEYKDQIIKYLHKLHNYFLYANISVTKYRRKYKGKAKVAAFKWKKIILYEVQRLSNILGGA